MLWEKPCSAETDKPSMRTPPTNLRDLLIADEGIKFHAYQDQFGYWTIGVGRLIDERKGGGLSLKEVQMLLDNDILDRVQGPLKISFPWTSGLSERRYAVLASMAFNMGMAGLKQFTQFLLTLESGDFAGAAQHMRDSLWHRQVTDRAERLAVQMETDSWQ